MGGLNIDACRIATNENLCGGQYSGKERQNGNCYGAHKNLNQELYKQPLGRFPANLIHDESSEVLEVFPETNKGAYPKIGNSKRNIYGKYAPVVKEIRIETAPGSASRFFYCAKASKEERNMGCNGLPLKQSNPNYGTNGFSRPTGEPERQQKPTPNNHPTVKPIALMEYLIKLTTKEEQVVLDPFIGSGTTALACKRLNRKFIGFEICPDYCIISEKRLKSIPERLEKYAMEE